VKIVKILLGIYDLFEGIFYGFWNEALMWVARTTLLLIFRF
jgi:hypothetical protein